MIILDLAKVFLPSILAFAVGILITPILTHYLYKYKMWKKKGGKVDMSGKDTPIFNKLHQENETKTPRMGGIVIWASAFITILGTWFLAHIIPNETIQKLDFLSRNQTWIPFSTLMLGALVGLINDLRDIRESEHGIAKGMSLKKRLLIVGAIGLLCSLWFYFKLDVMSIGLPGALVTFHLGWLFIPFFVLVVVGIYSGGIIDGIDGLAGGIFATIFAAYAGIAFYQQQIDLAAFCGLIVGGILAFLWFNIPPARFYMTETGTMGLTITLAVVAFMTDTLGGGYGILVLPIIAFPLIMTSLSNIIQVGSKKLRNGKKVFLVAPIHHHFEALGWPSYKVTMRFWIISIIFAIIGMILGLIG